MPLFTRAVRDTGPQHLALSLPFEWRQGQHMIVTGRTGSGKTTVCAALMYARQNVLSIRTKSDTARIPGAKIRTAKAFVDAELKSGEPNRFLLDPPFERQRDTIASALDAVWSEGGWTVYVDELYYLSEQLKLGDKVNMLLTQGRSKGITVVNGAQRPVHVSRFALSEATHVISFGGDRRDVKTLSEAVDDSFAGEVAKLGRYEFAWYYVPERRTYRGRLQDLLGDG